MNLTIALSIATVIHY